MSLAALIHFVQSGQGPFTAGQAAVGVDSTLVTVSNANDATVTRWQYSVVDAPPSSSITPGIKQDGATPTWSFTPDVPDEFLIQLTVFDSSGNFATDQRVFGVNRAGGRRKPAFKSTAAAANFGGQTRGWAPQAEAWLEHLDAVFWTDLATLHPKSTRLHQAIDGYRARGDGGEGHVFWNATDTRATDGGTVQQVTGIATGRWNRVGTGPTPGQSVSFNVKWFGATGDSITDDTAALQACMDAARATQLPFALDTATGSSVRVELPNGQYLITGTVFVPGFCEIFGHNQTLVFSTGYTFGLFQWEAHMSTIRNISFGRGKHGIVLWGTRPSHGDWGNPGDDTSITVSACAFREQRGGFSIYHDSSTVPTQLGNAFLKVRDCNFYTRSIFWGATESVVFDGGYMTANFDQSFQDDQGHDLGLFNSGGLLIVREMLGVPGLPTGTPCWFQTCNYVSLKNVRIGGEVPEVVTMRCRAAANFTYNSLALPNGSEQVPAVELQNCRMSGADTNWLEIYDNFPSLISVIDPAPTSDGVSEISSFPDTYGVWIDSASLPIANYESLDKAHCNIRLGTYGANAILFDPFKFRTSTDPTSSAGVEVTSVIKQYLIESHQHASYGAQPKDNLYYADVIEIIDLADVNSSNVTTSSTDTSTGYTLHKITATADGGFFEVSGFDGDGITKWGGTLPAGLYCFSAYVRGNSDGQVRFFANGVLAGSLRYTGSVTDGTGWQRVHWVFYHDGTAREIGLGVGPLQNTKYAIVGLLMVNEGPTPAPYVRPVDVPASPTKHLATIGYVPATYWGSAAPVSGTYNFGDIVRNTTPADGAPMGWVCIAGGTPGTWESFGIIGNVNPAYPLLAPNGSISAPSYSWSAETGSGWYRIGSGQYGFSVLGTNLAAWNLSRVTFQNIAEFLVVTSSDYALESGADGYLDQTTLHLRTESHVEFMTFAATGVAPTTDGAVPFGTDSHAFADFISYALHTRKLGSPSSSVPFDFDVQTFTGTPLGATLTVDTTKPRINLVGTVGAGTTVTLDFGNTSTGFYVVDISQLAAGAGIAPATLALKNGSDTVNITISTAAPTADVIVVLLSTNNIAMNL